MKYEEILELSFLNVDGNFREGTEEFHARKRISACDQQQFTVHRGDHRSPRAHRGLSIWYDGSWAVVRQNRGGGMNYPPGGKGITRLPVQPDVFRVGDVSHDPSIVASNRSGRSGVGRTDWRHLHQFEVTRTGDELTRQRRCHFFFNPRRWNHEGATILRHGGPTLWRAPYESSDVIHIYIYIFFFFSSFFLLLSLPPPLVWSTRWRINFTRLSTRHTTSWSFAMRHVSNSFFFFLFLTISRNESSFESDTRKRGSKGTRWDALTREDVYISQSRAGITVFHAFSLSEASVIYARSLLEISPRKVSGFVLTGWLIPLCCRCFQRDALNFVEIPSSFVYNR